MNFVSLLLVLMGIVLVLKGIFFVVMAWQTQTTDKYIINFVMKTIPAVSGWIDILCGIGLFLIRGFIF